MNGSTAEPDLSPLPDALRERVAAHWETYRGNAGRATVSGAVLETLPRVWACSELVALTCALHPGVLHELVESGDLERGYADGELGRRVAGAAGKVDSEASLYRLLRRIRKREAIRIAWRNLAGWADLEEVMATLSELADACIHAALTVLYELACAQRGTPRDDEGDPVAMSVLGLGKLGGRELNFSSDIDLIFAYRAEGRTDGDRPLSNHEFKARHPGDHHVTEDGYVFRVDMRLRPNGNSGRVVLRRHRPVLPGARA